MGKISSLIDNLRLEGTYHLLHQLWAECTLTAGRVNVAMTWSRDEVVVGIFTCSVVCTYPYLCVYLVSSFCPISLLGCTLEFCHVVSTRTSLMGAVASSLKSGVKKCGFSCKCWKKKSSTGCV